MDRKQLDNFREWFADKIASGLSDTQIQHLCQKYTKLELIESEVDLHSFITLIPEVHLSRRILLATDEDDALDRAGDADQVSCEYSHSLEPDEEPWEVKMEG